jgi:hypothetical protein
LLASFIKRDLATLLIEFSTPRYVPHKFFTGVGVSRRLSAVGNATPYLSFHQWFVQQIYKPARRQNKRVLYL